MIAKKHPGSKQPRERVTSSVQEAPPTEEPCLPATEAEQTFYYSDIAYADYMKMREAYPKLRLEYLDGCVYAMTSPSKNHHALVMRCLFMIQPQIQNRRCELYNTGLGTRADELTAEPDLVMHCGDAVWAENDPDVLTNPCLLIEVTSPSTRRNDERTKLEYYTRIPSLQYYLLISQRRREVTVWTREPDDWTVRIHTGRERIFLRNLEITLDLDRLYEGLPNPVPLEEVPPDQRAPR